MRLHTAVLLATLPLAAARPLPAQSADTAATGSRPGWSVRRTMNAFVRQVNGGRHHGRADLAGWFPRRGDWTWVVTRYPLGHAPGHAGLRRFAAAQTLSALEPGGPSCDSFGAEGSMVLGALVTYTQDELGSTWRQVGATRFVPPGDPPDSPVFVQWRREDGRWVIDAYGDEWRFPRVAGIGVEEIVPVRARTPLRLPLADTARLAAGAGWFESRRAIPGAGRSYWPLDDPPRRIENRPLVHFGTVRGVAAYAEPGAGPAPAVLYVPLDRTGTFHVYERAPDNGCDPRDEPADSR